MPNTQPPAVILVPEIDNFTQIQKQEVLKAFKRSKTLTRVVTYLSLGTALILAVLIGGITGITELGLIPHEVLTTPIREFMPFDVGAEHNPIFDKTLAELKNVKRIITTTFGAAGSLFFVFIWPMIQNSINIREFEIKLWKDFVNGKALDKPYTRSPIREDSWRTLTLRENLMLCIQRNPETVQKGLRKAAEIQQANLN